MKITVKLIGPFVQLLGFGEKEMDVPADTTVEGLVALVGVDRSRPRIVTRNGRAAAPGEGLAAGDRIAISPIYSGG
ncbi:MAG TPA: MoaD/ThiS family protein [Candidatus Aminicenantes bacterium]|nr:MoaD/ThiS family protein [Candidatus Aminicenantes bacterium]HRY65955.1 MoaD/ThiS family protein [Candidatus Aminicenantes bacterium]HRZ72996.1 MoaD/ThiS family protein [Candidatus Aminicenantes bacterium]